jgi:hypothetical protein
MDMNTKVYIVGDCHTARVYSHHIMANVAKNFFGPAGWHKDRTIGDTNISLKMWGLSGYKCWGTDFNEYDNKNMLCSPQEDIPELPPITDNLIDKFSFSEIKSADIVMPWMGYIDCRNFLPKYNNTEEVVKNYVEDSLSFFKESYIRFIEPFPQFEDLGTHNYPDTYSYELKNKQNEIFIEMLHKYSKKHGLMDPVSQSIVYDAVEDTMLKKRHVRLGGDYQDYTLLDALRPEYNKKIYLNLIPEIQKTVETYKTIN